MAALDLGRLVRMQAMVSAAQQEATGFAGGPLIRVYNSLVDEMSTILEQASGTRELRDELKRLFTYLDEPPALDQRAQLVAATEALLKIKQLAGWVQGLIDELTFEKKLKLEAEATAKLAARPRTGFSPQ